MVALIPKIKRMLQQEPGMILMYGLGFLISVVVVAAALYGATI